MRTVYDLTDRFPSLSTEDALTLRRASMTLTAWAEAECGNGNDHASWCIERNEKTGKPYRCIYPHNGPMRKHAIPDRENGALRRICSICARCGIHWYHQTDPRGASLYLSADPIDGSTYTSGVAVGKFLKVR
jgi:hypothetical protein